MRTVYKYPLAVEKTAVTGGDPRVVHVGVDPSGVDYLPCVWVELDPDGNNTLTLAYVGTGHEVPERWAHVGSAVTPAGFVWHVYGKPASDVVYVLLDGNVELGRWDTLDEAMAARKISGGTIQVAATGKVQP